MVHGADGGPHAPVEGERVEVSEVAGELLEVLGERFLRGVPVEGAEDGTRLPRVDGRGTGRRIREAGERVVGHDVTPGESLRGDGVGDLPGRDLAAAHGAGEDRQIVPALADPPRAAEPDVDAGLALDCVVTLDGLAGPADDQSLERAHRAPACERDPVPRRFCSGDTSE